MKIELSKEQYKKLITMSAIANGVFGILGDILVDTDYKKRSNAMDELEEYFLSFAQDFGYNNLIEKFERKELLNDEFYEKQILPILNDYEEYALHDGLAHKLARRDFKNDHTRADIQRMSKENGGYFGVAMYDYEKKYWDEFDKYGYERLEIANGKTDK